MIIKKSYINKNIEVRSSSIKGKGMFSKKKIKKGFVLIRWGGTFLNSNQIKRLNKDKYIIIQVEKDKYSVEPREKPEDDSYFINHSCDPNIWMKDGITFTAKRDIKKGEELSVDYSMFVSEDYVAKWKCKCGSKYCRKHITGRDYKIPEVQDRYKGHFSPLINRKIKSTKIS